MELINREALKAELLKNVEELADKTGFFEGIRMGYESALYFVDKAPTITSDDTDEPDYTTVYMVGYEDAKAKYSPKVGKWIEHPEHPIGDCSVCGERVPIYAGSKRYKICPYCGAIMDGKTK